MLDQQLIVVIAVVMGNCALAPIADAILGPGSDFLSNMLPTIPSLTGDNQFVSTSIDRRAAQKPSTFG